MRKKYNKTNWIDGVTPVKASTMNNIENALEELYLETLFPSQIKTGSGLRSDITKDGNIQISFESPVIQSKTVEGVEIITTDIENKRDNVLYYLLGEEGKIDKIFYGNELIFEKEVKQEEEPVEPEPEDPPIIEPEPEEPEDPEPEPEEPKPTIKDYIEQYNQLVEIVEKSLDVLDQDFVVNDPFTYKTLEEAKAKVIDPNKDRINEIYQAFELETEETEETVNTEENIQFVNSVISSLNTYVSVADKFENKVRDLETEKFIISFDLIPRFNTLIGTEQERQERIANDNIGNVIEGYHQIDGVFIALNKYREGVRIVTVDGVDVEEEITSLEQLKALIKDAVDRFNSAYRLMNSYLEAVKFKFGKCISEGEELYTLISNHYSQYEPDGVVLASNLTDALEIARTVLNNPESTTEDLELARETLLNSIQDIESRFDEEIFHEGEYYVTLNANFREKLDYANTDFRNSITHSVLIEELDSLLEEAEADYEMRDKVATGELEESDTIGISYLEFKSKFMSFVVKLKNLENKERLLNEQKEIISIKNEIYSKLEITNGIILAVDHKPAKDSFINEAKEYGRAYRDKETPLEDVVNEETNEVVTLGLRNILANLNELIVRINNELAAERNQDIIKYRSELRKLIELATKFLETSGGFADRELFANYINVSTIVWSTSIILEDIKDQTNILKELLIQYNIIEPENPVVEPSEPEEPVVEEPTEEPADPEPRNNDDPTIEDIIVDDENND